MKWYLADKAQDAIFAACALGAAYELGRVIGLVTDLIERWAS